MKNIPVRRKFYRLIPYTDSPDTSWSIDEQSIFRSHIKPDEESTIGYIHDEPFEWQNSLGVATSAHLVDHSSATYPSEQIDSRYETVINLLKDNDFTNARNYISDFIFLGASEKSLHWRNILSHTNLKVEKTSSAGKLQSNEQWINDNLKKFRGNWVALKDGKLLGYSNNKKDLFNEIKDKSALSDMLFIHL